MVWPILRRGDEDAWLDPEIHELEELQKMFKPCPSSWLMAEEVSPLVNSPKNNSPAVLEPVVNIGVERVRSLFDS